MKLPLKQQDVLIAQAIHDELKRQQNQIELIASENIVSRAILEAQGSILTNKYAEGYPGKRYYGGCRFVDEIETLAIERACMLFDCVFANVQPHSGSQANQAVFLALAKPGDTIFSLSLSSGGHLTHGAAPNLSGKWFNAQFYNVNPHTFLIDYDEVERLAFEHRPKIIIAGGSAYPRQIDFARFRAIADQVGAYLMVDMAHFAGLVAAKVFSSPLPFAHVVTTTTHKTLRGPRGGMILSQDPNMIKKINSAIFPGLQGGPLMHVIAAKAVCFQEALHPSFQDYGAQVIKNAQQMGKTLKERGFSVLTGGTDCHLILVNVFEKGLTGQQAETALEEAGMTCNKNSLPFDTLSPTKASGIRLGSPAGTSRGFQEAEFEQIAHLIADVLEALEKGKEASLMPLVSEKILQLCKKFPIYEEE